MLTGMLSEAYASYQDSAPSQYSSLLAATSSFTGVGLVLIVLTFYLPSSYLNTQKLRVMSRGMEAM
jgi:hypothetical protein